MNTVDREKFCWKKSDDDFDGMMSTLTDKICSWKKKTLDLFTINAKTFWRKIFWCRRTRG